MAAVTNALIACWDAKYTYMFWRPVTAIRAGDTDGNSKTEPDPAWTPFIVTPSHPEYPAAHTTVGASVLGFYTVWVDTDQFPLAFKGNGGAVRLYTSVNEIHAEEGNARVGRDALAPQHRGGYRGRQQSRQVHGEASSQAARSLIGRDHTLQSRFMNSKAARDLGADA